MASIHQFQERAKQINPSQVRNDLLKYFKSIEELFFKLNMSQLQNQQNAKGKRLKNKNNVFSGLYTKSTELKAKKENPLTPKIAGKPYTFLWSGKFRKGFEMFVKTGKIEIFSNGYSESEKKSFFEGFDDLYGLTDSSLLKVIDDVLPYIQGFYRNKLDI